jgi:hypothetical protein
MNGPGRTRQDPCLQRPRATLGTRWGSKTWPTIKARVAWRLSTHALGAATTWGEVPSPGDLFDVRPRPLLRQGFGRAGFCRDLRSSVGKIPWGLTAPDNQV